MSAKSRAELVDGDPEELEAALVAAARFAARHHAGGVDGRILPPESHAAIAADHSEGLPEDGVTLSELVEELSGEISARATGFGNPGFMGMITARANPYALVAETLAPAVNQHAARQDVAPFAAAIEAEALRWIGAFTGFDPAAQGVFTSGGSAANITALAAAVRSKASFDIANSGMRGGPPQTVYASDQSHFSVKKAVDLIGIGLDNLRLLEADADGRMDPTGLARAIAEDKVAGRAPAVVIANAGTAPSGAVDPIDAIADICSDEDLWLHVDGAYGAPAASTPMARPMFAGMARADSVTIDPHKWLYVPYECGCLLVHDEAALRSAFKYVASYAMPGGETARDFMHLSLQMSRDFKALKVWATLRGLGAARLRQAIEGDIRLMRAFGVRLSQIPGFELLAPTALSIACFRLHPKGIDDEARLDALNARLLEAVLARGDLFITPVELGGRRGLRACSINHRFDVEHVERAARTLEDCARELMVSDPAAE